MLAGGLFAEPHSGSSQTASEHNSEAIQEAKHLVFGLETGSFG